MQQSLVPGSLGAIAKRDSKSLAQVFLDADEIVLVDTSGSMGTQDSTGGMSRYDVACQELRKLQRDMQGKLAIFAFSSTCVFCPSGVPTMLKRDTNLLGALQYLSAADGVINFTIISDGYPDPGTDYEIINLVSAMQSRVNTIFAGPTEDERGRKFMDQLAHVGRGRSYFSAQASDLSSAVKLLMERTQ